MLERSKRSECRKKAKGNKLAQAQAETRRCLALLEQEREKNRALGARVPPRGWRMEMPESPDPTSQRRARCLACGTKERPWYFQTLCDFHGTCREHYPGVVMLSRTTSHFSRTREWPNLSVVRDGVPRFGTVLPVCPYCYYEKIPYDQVPRTPQGKPIPHHELVTLFTRYLLQRDPPPALIPLGSVPSAESIFRRPMPNARKRVPSERGSSETVEGGAGEKRAAVGQGEQPEAKVTTAGAETSDDEYVIDDGEWDVAEMCD